MTIMATMFIQNEMKQKWGKNLCSKFIRVNRSFQANRDERGVASQGPWNTN